MGYTPQPDEVTSERGRGPGDARATLAEPRRTVDDRERDPDGPLIPPHPTGFVQELLQRNRLLVPDVIDSSNPRLKDGRFHGTQKVRSREQLEYRRFRPHTEKASPGEPARGFNHQDSAPVDQAEIGRASCRE